MSSYSLAFHVRCMVKSCLFSGVFFFFCKSKRINLHKCLYVTVWVVFASCWRLVSVSSWQTALRCWTLHFIGLYVMATGIWFSVYVVSVYFVMLINVLNRVHMARVMFGTCKKIFYFQFFFFNFEDFKIFCYCLYACCIWWYVTR